MTWLPRSAGWAAWFNAWIDGFVPLDDAVAAVLADDAAHDVIGLGDESVPLADAWLELRARGTHSAVAALPIPGDLSCLAGPSEFNQAALEAGETALLVGCDLGVVPSAVGRGVFWSAHPANPPLGTDPLPDAERRLREQLVETGRELADLDVARWRPEVADALSSLRETQDGVLPPGYDERAERVAALAQRCLRIGDLALADDGAAATAAEGTARRQTIDLLCRAARHATVSACARRPSR